tara:strand:+ start:1721 stop:3274 length:1554 start_codon:yes stop_codon:yes gene_type:complete
MARVRTEKFADALHKLGALRPDSPLGVLDIGSNSVRLVGYSGSARTPLPIYNERAFCRLGEAVSAIGRIEGEPYELAIMTFRRFRAIAERLGIDNLAAFATAAVREAENRDAFVAEAEEILGHKIRVLSGKEEAKYSADGVMLAIPGANGIVADLGGGSLELARVKNGETQRWATLPLGILALREYSKNNRAAMIEIIEAALEKVKWLKKGRELPLYIVGGTWRNLAKVHMARTGYPLEVLHQYEIASSEAVQFSEKISALKNWQALKLEASSSNRRAGLPTAALVLTELMARAEPSRVIVSANAVREGVLYSILEPKYRALDPLLLACEEMAERLCKSASYGHELAEWSSKIFKKSKWSMGGAGAFSRLREAGCLLSDVAWASHPSWRAETIRQMVLTAPFSGIRHIERVFLAFALSYRHEGNVPQSFGGALELSKSDQCLARAMGLSFRLAHSLSASLPGALPMTQLRAGRKFLTLTIDPSRAELFGPIISKRLAAVAVELDLLARVEIKPLKTA